MIVKAIECKSILTNSRVYVTAFPNARLQVIAGAGHFPFYEQPEAFAAVVGEFLRLTFGSGK